MSIRHTQDYELIISAAERIAHERGDDYVGVEHLMLAILADPDAVPTFELRHRMGVDVAELVRQLNLFLDAPIPGPGQYRVRSLDGTITMRPA
ncbi:Clp protease N-terminal domain-containing protein [Nocardia sp. NBC_01730]|uniref:Clp protease N-terminal domain-containing protein n=1 Tax=Nocardia sp. NBC_01730 TaxID=2975998 RepID=UPI002E12E968|nr:Clp protease N-terminal domain-containing protein [Nocardia sp. NBC_01730]